jgi:hypothetical protein
VKRFFVCGSGRNRGFGGDGFAHLKAHEAANGNLVAELLGHGT